MGKPHIKVTVKNEKDPQGNHHMTFRFDGSNGGLLHPKDSQKISGSIPETPVGTINKIDLGATGMTVKLTSPGDIQSFKAELYRNNIIGPQQAAQIENKMDALTRKIQR